MVSLGELPYSEGTNLSLEKLEETNDENCNLAEILDLYKGKQRIPSSFQMQYSIIVNPNPLFKCQSPIPVHDNNLEESDLNVTKTDPLQELSQEGSRNPTKEFIVRMTPMMQRRKALGNSYYRNAIMKAAGVKENVIEQLEDQGTISS